MLVNDCSKNKDALRKFWQKQCCVIMMKDNTEYLNRKSYIIFFEP